MGQSQAGVLTRNQSILEGSRSDSSSSSGTSGGRTTIRRWHRKDRSTSERMGFPAHWTRNDTRPTVLNRVLPETQPMGAISKFPLGVVNRPEQVFLGLVLDKAGQANEAHSGASPQR